MQLWTVMEGFLEANPSPSFTARSIVAGLEGPAAGVAVHPAPYTVLNGWIRFAGTPVISVDDACMAIWRIDVLTYSKHAKAKEDGDWLEMYQSADIQMETRNPDGTITIAQAEGVACEACGLMCLLALIQVDHQHPVMGGTTLAICKVMRAIGLTLAPPKGNKGKAIRQNMAGTLNAYPSQNPGGPYLLIKNPKGVPQPWGGHAPKSALGHANLANHNRYTLSAQGNAVLSAVRACPAPNFSARFDKKCLNSYVNLKPLCVTCNVAKGNTLKLQ